MDSALQLTATLAAVTSSPTMPTPALVPVADFEVFTSIPDHARHPRRVQPVTTTLTSVDEAEALRETAQELFTDV